MLVGPGAGSPQALVLEAPLHQPPRSPAPMKDCTYIMGCPGIVFPQVFPSYLGDKSRLTQEDILVVSAALTSLFLLLCLV